MPKRSTFRYQRTMEVSSARTVLRSRRRLAMASSVTAGMFAAWQLRRAFQKEAQRRDDLTRSLKRWGSRIPRCLGVAADIHGDVPLIQGDRPTLVVANHRSALDIPILLGLFGGRMLSRGDLAGWPMVGPVADAVGTVFVDRDDPQSGAQAIRTMRRVLRAGHTLIAFPEGTTYPGDEVREFHPGVFAAARGTGAVIVPVGLRVPKDVAWWQVSFSQHLIDVAARPRSRIVVNIGDGYAPQGTTSEIRRTMRQRVQALVGETHG